MGGDPRRQGAPADQLPNFYHGVLTFERCFLNVTSTKKVVNFLGKKCTATDKKILASRTKKKAPALRWYGAPNG